MIAKPTLRGIQVRSGLIDPFAGDFQVQGGKILRVERSANRPFPFETSGVRRTGEKVTTALVSYDNVLVVEEWSRGELAAGALQLKLYAPDLGYVSVGWEGNDPVKETLELVKVKQLDSNEMAEARAAVLALEDRSYYYGRETKPLRRRQD